MSDLSQVSGRRKDGITFALMVALIVAVVGWGLWYA